LPCSLCSEFLYCYFSSDFTVPGVDIPSGEAATLADFGQGECPVAGGLQAVVDSAVAVAVFQVAVVASAAAEQEEAGK
jgi:hypothetical protein